MPGGSLALLLGDERLDETEHRELMRLGRPKVVVVMNQRRAGPLLDFARQHRDVEVLAPASISKAIRGALGRPVGSLSQARTLLPATVRVLLPKGLRVDECWLQVMTSLGAVWLVNEAFTWWPHLPHELRGLGLWLRGHRAGLHISPGYRRLVIADAGEFRGWFFGLLRETHPAMLMGTVGHVLHDPSLQTRLRREVEALR
ncbi:MAG: hypothetical protein H6746_19595 [Deltaproteobacteria bacterium]|nr:hypothetical protein [Deltaproteobacteria bacterium]